MWGERRLWVLTAIHNEARVSASLETAQRHLDKKRHELEAKREQVAESEAKGHGSRLEQRQRAATVLDEEVGQAQQHEAHLQNQVDGFGAPKEADRSRCAQVGDHDHSHAVPGQSASGLSGHVGSRVASARESGVAVEATLRAQWSWIERDQKVMYGVNATGLPRSNRRVLGEIVDGLNQLRLVARGKTARVCLKELPP